MKLGEPWVDKTTSTSRQRDRKGNKVHTTVYRVFWYVYYPDGSKTRRKRSGFPTKGLAETFVETLRKAEFGADGWRLDADGFPVSAESPASAVPQRPESVLDALEVFVSAHWGTVWKSPNTKEKNRGRLLVLAAAMLDDEAAADKVLAALAEQVMNRRVRHEPVTREQWAARYLRDHALTPGQGPVDGEVPELMAAKAWLEAHSLPLTDLDDVRLVALRDRSAALAHSTQRTYWNTTKQVLHWLVASGRLDRNPAMAMPALKRDLDAEQVDAERAPDEDEIWKLAEYAEQRFGLATAVLIVVLFYAALRIGEAAGLRRAHITFHPSGHATLSIRTQHDRVTARYNAGETHREDTPKGRTSGPGSRRTVVIPTIAAKSLRRHLDAVGDKRPGAFVFRQPRGGPLDDDYFRQQRWNPAVEAVFGSGHRLSGITPHACRHGGMTFWLRCRVPFKTIQRFGGWHSLKVMLDVYAAVLPDDLAEAVEAIEVGSRAA